MSKKGLIERLNKGPVICAEGFLFEIEKLPKLAEVGEIGAPQKRGASQI